MKLGGEKGVIEHFLRDCDVRPVSPHTMISYRHHLGVLVRLLQALCQVSELEEVTVLHLRVCVQYLLRTPAETVRGVYRRDGDTLDVSSVAAYVRCWKSFFSWCYKEGLISSNPADSRLSLPKSTKRVKPTFSDEHIEKMLSSCDLSTEGGFRDYVILLLLLDTGIRLSEIGSLRLEDYHDTYIKVFGKGRKEREIGLHPDVGKLLWVYIYKHRRPVNPGEPSLFLSCGRKDRGTAFTASGVRFVLERIKKATGLDADVGIRFSAHTFRHTFAKMYMEQGGEVLSLSREMGHSDVDITKEYLEDFTSLDARKKHTSFSPIGRINLKNRSKMKRSVDVRKKSR
jgi:integrase/recombinase XerD